MKKFSLSYVNETMCLFGGLFSFKTYINCFVDTIYLTQRHLVWRGLPLCRYVCCGRETWYDSLNLEVFLLSMINSLLTGIRCLAKNWQGAIFSAHFCCLLSEALSILFVL